MVRQLKDLREELDLIKDNAIREWTEATLKNVPKYFWIAKASSSGKYHPACTNKEGGLITHIKRVVYLANRLCEGWGIFDLNRDIVISACILHDIAKTPCPKVAHLYGMKTTDEDFVNHPVYAHNYFSGLEIISEEILQTINQCICYHMGRWTPECIKKDISSYSLMELAVYTCDYLATTKALITPVDNK